MIGATVRQSLRVWYDRIPWHNWGYAAYYLMLLGMGLSALLYTPSTIVAGAGAFLTYVWAYAGIGCGLIGLYGALGPTIRFPRISLENRRVRWELHTYVAPNFRAEQGAAIAGMVAVFIYSSTVWILVWANGESTRSAQGFAIAAHFFPLAIRYVYFHLREKTEVQKRVALAALHRDGLDPLTGPVRAAGAE